MFAKLVFNLNVTVGQVNRDIARLINASATGSANLSNLEFITVASSELFAGVNSGWTLHTSTPLRTGAITASDSRYILQGTTASGRLKYIGIQSHADWTNAAAFSSTSTATNMCPVLNPGGALEFWGAGFTGTSGEMLGYNGVIGSLGDRTVYIWADPRKCVVVGAQASYGLVVLASLEYTPTALSTWQAMPEVGFWRWMARGPGATNAYSSTFARRGDTAYTDTVQDGFAMMQFCGSLYSPRENVLYRSWAVGNFVEGDSSRRLPIHRVFDNGTATGLSQAVISSPPEIIGDVSISQFFNVQSESSTLYNNSTAITFNAAGERSIPLIPVHVSPWTHAPETYDFSVANGVYHAPGGIGFIGDTVTLPNNQVWIYVPYGASTNGGALMIRRD